MIRFILLQNRQGRTRLSRWYVGCNAAEKTKLEGEIHRAVTHRDRKWSNFIDYRQFRLIVRQYAGLFFTLCVDVNDNELAMYEIIHLLVETLDAYFGNVCELDLIFNFNKVYSLLDDIILGGEICDTSQGEVVSRLRGTDRLP